MRSILNKATLTVRTQFENTFKGPKELDIQPQSLIANITLKQLREQPSDQVSDIYTIGILSSKITFSDIGSMLKLNMY